MDIKILTSVTPMSEEFRNTFVIGTHGGIFHADEVVAISILYMLHRNEKVRILRTRDIDILNECCICVDVGGGKYDHHQKGFNLCREENGVMYASAGLIWKEYGEKLICGMIPQYFKESSINDFKIQNIYKEVWKIVDEEVISAVDAEDNGEDVSNHCFSYISSYLPLWFDANFNEQFLKVLKVTIDMLEQKILQIAQKCIAELILKERWSRKGNVQELIEGKCTFSENILDIPSQTIPWVQTVIEFNESIFTPFLKEASIDFVIFPYPAGGWAAQCVPPSFEQKFEKRIPFPSKWAGQTDKLPEISGIDDAVFCHNGRFFVRAETKESVIKMCKLAMEK